MVGDLAQTLGMLNERGRAHGAFDFDLSRQRDLRRRMQDEFRMHADDDVEGPIRPQKLLWDVRQTLGPHDIVLPDVGAHKMWIARNYQFHEPNHFQITTGFCSMGAAPIGKTSVGERACKSVLNSVV